MRHNGHIFETSLHCKYNTEPEGKRRVINVLLMLRGYEAEDPEPEAISIGDE